MRRRRRISFPLAIATVSVAAIVIIMADDIAAMLERTTSAPWAFNAPENQPVGAWEGMFQGRRITLRLELAVWRDGDRRGGKRGSIKRENGFFFRRLELLPQSTAFVRGTLTVAGPGGETDRFETEGAPNSRGTQALLNVHGADGAAGLMIEKADMSFAPSQAEAALRYRVPGKSGYVTAGVVWSPVSQPGLVTLQRK